jgi:hypothetical protein
VKNCDVELISAYIDGELPESEAARLRAHMEECGSCNALCRDFTALKEGFAALETSPPDTLVPGIFYKIGLGEETPRVRRVIGRLVAVAACAAVVMIAARPSDTPDGYNTLTIPEIGQAVMDNAGGGDRMYPPGGKDLQMSAGDELGPEAAPDAGAGYALGGADAPGSIGLDDFLALLRESRLEYAVSDQAAVSERRIWIGDPPYEEAELILDDDVIIIFIGNGIDIGDIIEKTRR